jgi:hypothetical protein
MTRLSYRPVVLLLLAVAIVIQLAILLKPAPSVPAATPRARLAALVWKPHDKPLEFRAVSSRPDGLWDDGVYLTTTEKTLRELTQWPVNSDFADRWAGTIVIMRRSDDELGDASWVYGDFVFFGDKELLDKVRHCLLED